MARKDRPRAEKGGLAEVCRPSGTGEGSRQKKKAKGDRKRNKRKKQGDKERGKTSRLER